VSGSGDVTAMPASDLVNTGAQSDNDGDRPAAVAQPQCLNCGAIVAGRFCQRCGQRHDPHVHTVRHFLREATEDLTHADSRVWSTLFALLFKPGFLTREFFAGKRARYLPPVRLYLVVSVLMFLMVSLTSKDVKVLQFDSTDTSKAPRCKTLVYNGPAAQWLLPRLRAGCERTVADNGHAAGEAFLHNIPRMMFVFLPLIAFFMMLLYWRPRRYYVEHLLFYIHNHAFVFLAGTLAILAGMLPFAWPTIFSIAFWIYLFWYFYKSMRAFYGQSRKLTIAKLAVMGCVYTVLATFMVGIVGFFSVLTL
jgi:hypothetical protein